MSEPTIELLDPKNDYVFFRLFSEEPELLVDLINAVRSHEPPIASVISPSASRPGSPTSNTGRRRPS